MIVPVPRGSEISAPAALWSPATKVSFSSAVASPAMSMRTLLRLTRLERERLRLRCVVGRAGGRPIPRAHAHGDVLGARPGELDREGHLRNRPGASLHRIAVGDRERPRLGEGGDGERDQAGPPAPPAATALPRIASIRLAMAPAYRSCAPFYPSSSMLRSSAGAEWVSAPTEMKSTPVAPIAATFSRVTPPEASSSTRPPEGSNRAGRSRARGPRGSCCRAAGAPRPR